MALAFLRLLFLFSFAAFTIFLISRLARRRTFARPTPSSASIDPFAVLGIARGASAAEIRDAYHRELSKYHPDKVAHLGEAIQRVAAAKTAEIMQAYEQLVPRARR